MAISSSFASVSEQIVNYNNNVLELLSKLNNISVSNESSVSVNISDQFGVLKTYNIPSLGYLKSEIQRLNNNINTLYNIDSSGALIQSANNKFKKIITIDLNKEPASVGELNLIRTFSAKRNWFFDSLVDPQILVSIDLNGKVEDSVRKCLSRRYIVEFTKNADDTLTNLGQSALNSFNQNYRTKANIQLDDFLYWHATTPGISNATIPNYDEQLFDLEPNELLYDGTFTVIKTEEDRLNRKFWYHINTLNYIISKTNEIKQLAIGDELIINLPSASTRYRILEISTLSSNFRIRVETVEGIQPIPVGTNTLKIYSPLVLNKVVNISVGYDERNVVFVKPMDANNHLLAKNWSLGSGYWTNDLILTSGDSDNGSNLEKYYSTNINDYGQVLEDLVTKKIPTKLGAIPTPPVLIANNFKVVQINKHLTDTADSNLIKVKHNQLNDTKSELSQLSEAIDSKQKQAKIIKVNSSAEKNQFDNELDELIKKKDSRTKLYSTLVTEIVTLGSSKPNLSLAKYRLRGFFDMPSAVIVRGSKPQEVVQFKIEYRYLSKDGKESPVETYKIQNQEGKTISNAAFSNWIPYLSDARKRVKDENGNLIWQIQNVSDADTPNINQIDLSLQQGEKIQIRVKSLSEVGYPDSPIESDWSEVLEYEFPDDLNNVLGDSDFILKQATQEELKVRLDSELNARGLNDVLNNVVTLNNKVYTSSSDFILSGFKDQNGTAIDLYTYLKSLQDKIAGLEERIKRAKGELKVTIFRNNDEYIVKNGSELSFNVECEDYCELFTGSSVQTGRVWSNNIYVVKDFIMKVQNVAIESPLGLLSNRTYYTNSELFNNSAPQTFWVNERDELVYSQVTGSTRTQLDNQFLWSVNYDVTNQTTVTKLSDNIGNTFLSANNNNLINALSSTDFNIGYSDTSLLSFVGSNNSLLEMQKWSDTAISVASNNKLLTSVHPVVPDLNKLTELNTEKVRSVSPGANNDIIIPINIYFKMNALDPNTGTGNNYQYINLNNTQTTIKHIKKVKFMLENESENRPFIFTVKFNINRSKIGVQKITNSTKTTISSQI